MATFTERLELLISGQSTSAVSALNKTATASEELTLKQKAMGVATSGATNALTSLGIPAEATGSALKVAAGAAAALGAVKVAEWAIGATNETAALSDEIRNFSRASGAGAEDSSRWVAALDDLQVSTEAGSKAAFKLGREAATGGDKLAQFGVEVAKNKDGTTNLTETLLNVADAYVATDDPAQRAALAAAAFGKAGKDLIPVLEQGRKGLQDFFAGAEQGHQIMSQDDLDRMRSYELAIDNLGDAFRGIKIEVGKAAAPILTTFANTLSDSLTAVDDATARFGGLGKVISTGIDFSPLGEGMHLVSSASKLLAGDFAGAGEQFARSLPVIGGVIGLFDDGADSTTKFADAQTKLKDAQAQVLNLTAAGATNTKDYADAVRDANAAQAEVDATTQKVTKALTDQSVAEFEATQQHLALASAGLAVQQSMLNLSGALADETQATNDATAAAQFGVDQSATVQAAHLKTEDAILKVIAAAQAKAVQEAGPSATASEKATAANEATAASIASIAQTTPGAIKALQDLGYQVITLPSGEVVVTANTTDAERKIANLQAQIAEFIRFASQPGAFNPPIGVGFGPTSAQSVGIAAAPAAALGAAEADTLDVEAVTPMPVGAGRAVMPLTAAAPVINLAVTVQTKGLGADAPEIQRAVVEAVRGYVERNGRLVGIA